MATNTQTKFPRTQEDAIAESVSDLAWRTKAGEDMAAAAIHAGGIEEDITKLPTTEHTHSQIEHPGNDEDDIAQLRESLNSDDTWGEFIRRGQ